MRRKRENLRMAVRNTRKETANLDDPAHELLGRRKRPEQSRFHLRVDRQTKASYETNEAAEVAGLAIKNGHPILHVEVFDAVAGVSRVIELLKETT
jgi:hypothetical protein